MTIDHVLVSEEFNPASRYAVGEVLDVMTGLAQDGMTMMVVTHEMGFARRVADRVVFMDGGAVVEDADKDAFFDAPARRRWWRAAWPTASA